LRVSYLAFPALSGSFQVRETERNVYKLTGTPLQQWSEEELRRIRLVLQKLTALRVDNPEDAEDLVQETLLTMAAKCADTRIQKGLLIWAMGILRKKVGNYYRRMQRSVPLEVDPARPDLLLSPESWLRHGELCALIEKILDGFSSAEREAVELLLTGLQTNEIAEQLQPERYQNVVNRLYRGRKKLAMQLARYGYRSGSGPRARVRNR
jgi:RNA polymerase sigma factor (sigma-70 family)